MTGSLEDRSAAVGPILVGAAARHRGATLLPIPLLLSVTCGSPPPTPGVAVEFVTAIGSAPNAASAPGAVEFGRIGALATDASDRLYVLDSEYLRVLVFRPDGSLERSMELKPGDGPGEFARPGDMAVTPDGTVFVLDVQHRSVSAWSADGRLIKTFGATGRPTRIAVGPDVVYLAKLWLTTGDLVVEVLSRDGTPIRSVVEKPDGWRNVAMTGNFERMVVAPNGHLVYSYPSPYRVLELDDQGAVQRDIAGPVEFTRDPRTTDGRTYTMFQGSRALALRPDGSLVNVVMDGDAWFVDFFDSDWRFTARLDTSAFGVPAFRHIAVSSSGDLFLDVDSPVPHVRRYALR